MPKISIVSLGCPKNQVDAEILLSFLKNDGFELTEDVGLADAVIVNTCGFIESAKREAIDELLELAELKKEGRIKAIIVTGCLAERYRGQISEEIPEVDSVVGIGANESIAEAVRSALDGEKKELYDDKEKLPLNSDRILSTCDYAYLKIAEGCDNKCSYCAIPGIRGAFRSRPFEEVVEEARWLAENDIKEIVLVAQDTTGYGCDLYGRSRLPELIDEISKIEGVRWIRVLYCYPEHITDELLDVLASNDKAVKYMDIPLQHSNGRVLSAMNRRGNDESLRNLIKKIRGRVPGVVIRTTLIVGFPGETDEEFGELLHFVKDMKFERLGCFAYSPEEETPAFELPDRVDPETADRRQQIITEQQLAILDDWCEEQVGSTVSVLVEGYDRYAACYFGRSYADAPEIDCKIFFKSSQKLRVGDFENVIITESLDGDLVGERVG